MTILTSEATKKTVLTQILFETVNKLIDVNEVVDRLQALDCEECSLFTAEEVKFAFLKWIEHHIESIEMQPEWFINQDFKHFEKHLPFDELQYATELREYDYEETYSDMARESELEDDFEGTPEQVALESTFW